MSIYEKIKDLDGWLTRGEAELLYGLAKKTKGRGRIVEIGSWKGRSTICLASGAREAGAGKVVAIDPHIGSSEHQKNNPGLNTFAEFSSNITKAGVADMVDPRVLTSEAAAADFNEPVELVFIDGGHEYELVKKDFDLWFPKVVDGGVVAFHDTIVWGGPKEVVKQHLFRSRHFKKAGFVDSISYGIKTEKENSLWDVVGNRWALLGKDVFEFSFRLSKKIKILKKISPLARKFFRVFK